MKRLFAAMLLLSGMLGIWSCAKRDFLYMNPDADVYPIEFKSNSLVIASNTVSTNQNLTKADAAIPDGTTIRVVVFKRTGTNPEPATDIYMTEKTYGVSEGLLVPCAVNAAGDLDALTPDDKMTLAKGTYDFYAYSPAIPMPVRPKLSVGQADDLTAVSPVSANIGENQTVDLGIFYHKGAQMQFTITRRESSVTHIEVEPAGITVEKLAAAPAEYTLGGEIAAGQTYTGSITLPASVFSPIDDYTTSGLTCVLPRQENVNDADKLKITFNLLINGTTPKVYTTELAAQWLRPGNRYKFVFTVREGSATLSMFELLPWITHVIADNNVGGDSSNGILLEEWSTIDWGGSGIGGKGGGEI